jgi:hypothetical protein
LTLNVTLKLDGILNMGPFSVSKKHAWKKCLKFTVLNCIICSTSGGSNIILILQKMKQILSILANVTSEQWNWNLRQVSMASENPEGNEQI